MDKTDFSIQYSYWLDVQNKFHIIIYHYLLFVIWNNELCFFYV